MEGKKKLKVLNLCLLLLLVCSCGTTKIICPESNAEIYLDNSYVGQGTAKVKSVGFPHTAYLEARKGGRVIGKTTMSRSFTFNTFLIGLCTYYSGFIWAWYYPDDVTIPVYSGYKSGFDNKSPWDNSEESIWSQPIQKQKK